MLSTSGHVRLLSSLVVATAMFAGALQGQGCEPIRFTTPVGLGGKGEAYQREQQWRFTLAYRRLYPDEFFSGSTESSAAFFGGAGKDPKFNINTFVGDIAYAPTDRLLLHLSVPFQTGSESGARRDGVVHASAVNGIGDVSVIGEVWMFSPKTYDRGNISLGLGLKAPTGSNLARSSDWDASGAEEPIAASATIRPGDGGWAILPSVQAFHQVGKHAFLHANGSYMVNPKAQSVLFDGVTQAY